LEGHGNDDIEMSVPGFGVPKVYEFANLFDRSWFQLEDYAEEMYDSLALEQDKFMSLLCAVNTDLCDDADVESFASADIFTV